MQFNLSRQTVGRLLVFATVFLCLASTGTEISYYLLDHKRLLGLVGQFSLGYEANVPTWYSSVLLLACAAVLAVIGFSRPPGKGGYRRHWLALAAIFAYMSLDEAAVLHEGLIPLTHYLAQPFGITLEGAFYLAWTLPAAVLLVVFGVCYLGFLKYLPAGSRNGFILAGLVYVGGAFGTEFLLSYWIDVHGDNFVHGMLNVLQETMEIAGASLFLYVLLRHIETETGEVQINVRY